MSLRWGMTLGHTSHYSLIRLVLIIVFGRILYPAIHWKSRLILGTHRRKSSLPDRVKSTSKMPRHSCHSCLAQMSSPPVSQSLFASLSSSAKRSCCHFSKKNMQTNAIFHQKGIGFSEKRRVNGKIRLSRQPPTRGMGSWLCFLASSARSLSRSGPYFLSSFQGLLLLL